MKSSRITIAAGLLILLGIVYLLLLPGREKTASTDSAQFMFNKDLVSEIHLYNHADTLDFLLNDMHRWILDDYPADTTKVQRLIESFATLVTDRLVSTNPEKQDRYKLGEPSHTRIDFVSDNGTHLLSLIIGTKGANYKETFVRVPSTDEIFAVKAALTHYQTTKKKDYWDRTITDFDLDAIEDVLFSGTIAYHLKREGPIWSFDGTAVDLDKVTTMLKPLENLIATNILSSMPDEVNSYQKISLGKTDGTRITLDFYEQPKSASVLLVKVSGKDKVFEYSKSGLNRYKKSAGDLKVEQVDT